METVRANLRVEAPPPDAEGEHRLADAGRVLGAGRVAGYVGPGVRLHDGDGGTLSGATERALADELARRSRGTRLAHWWSRTLGLWWWLHVSEPVWSRVSSLLRRTRILDTPNGSES